MIDLGLHIALGITTASVFVLAYRLRLEKARYRKLQDREELLEGYYNEEAEDVINITHDLNALAERYKAQAEELKECNKHLDAAKKLIIKYNNLNK